MDDPRLVVVGSTGIDTIETVHERHENLLGGAASYACAAASFFSSTGMVGVVGTDFPKAHHELYQRLGIDIEGLQVQEGKTFYWAGRYHENMDRRDTLVTELNVFADFMPHLPDAYRTAPYILLANIAPSLQLHVLDQVDKPEFVAADTMNLWIDTARDELLELIGRVDLMTMNESEAEQLTDCRNLALAADWILERGPKYVLIKKGEHGCMFFSRDDVFILPAYPLREVADPTGAGDSFAGAMMGYIASKGNVSDDVLRRAFLYGSTLATFTVEAFGLRRLAALSSSDIDNRVADYERAITVPAEPS